MATTMTADAEKAKNARVREAKGAVVEAERNLKAVTKDIAATIRAETKRLADAEKRLEDVRRSLAHAEATATGNIEKAAEPKRRGRPRKTPKPEND